MSEIPATEFKAKCLELMDRVAEKSESFVITKRGKPVARLVPVTARKRDRLFGALRGMATDVGDIVSPVDGIEWGTLEEWDELEKDAADALPKRRQRRTARHK